MTINLNHQHQICNFLFVILAIISALLLSGNYGYNVYALDKEENSLVVDYSKFNAKETRISADRYFQMALESQNNEETQKYLQEAEAQYYILSNLDKADAYPCIQLGRIYDLQQNDAYAKAYYYRALGLNYKNPDANHYFAEFYYKRKQYKKALEYYQNALKYGKTEDSDTLKKLGKIYERFGDIQRTNLYYKKSFELNPKDSELLNKINENVKQEYEKSGYYKRRLRY